MHSVGQRYNRRKQQRDRSVCARELYMCAGTVVTSKEVCSGKKKSVLSLERQRFASYL